MTEENQDDITEKYNVSVEDLPNSRKKITGQIPWEEVTSHREAVLNALAQNMEVDGFREGNAPEKVIVDKVGEEQITQRMAQRALQSVYPKIAAETGVQAVGRPQLSIKKMAKDNPLEFEAEVAVLPDIDLPDYEEIASQHSTDTQEIEVDEDDVEEAVNNVRRQFVQAERMEKIQNMNEKEGDELTEEAAQMDPSQMKVEDEDLPELTDDFVQQIGDFEDVSDFKSKLRQNMLQEEQRKARESQRLEIVEEIIEKSDMEVPEILVESELERMMNQFRGDVQQAGVEFDDYLDRIDKTQEELREEWRPDAEKQAKMQLILNSIAAREGIEPNEQEVEQEVSRLMNEYESANEDRTRTYVSTMLRNEKVFEYLENQ